MEVIRMQGKEDRGNDVDKIFGEYLRSQMDWKNIRQHELAEKSGVSQERISRIVNGVSRISLRDFVTLCAVLDADITKELFRRAGRDCKYYVSKLKKYLLGAGTIIDITPTQRKDFNVPTPSHPLFQAPRPSSEIKEHKPGHPLNDDRMFPMFRFHDGVWITAPIFAHFNQHCCSFQHESGMA
jgi:transcriptional regulator with XRE-family HTH domain